MKQAVLQTCRPAAIQHTAILNECYRTSARAEAGISVMTYVPRVSMSLNSSGGLQKLVESVSQKIESKKCEKSKNFLDNPYNPKHVFSLFFSLSLSLSLSLD